MKKLLLLTYTIFFALFFLCCSKDNSSSENNDGTGTGGSLARFTIYGDHLYTVDHATLKTYNLSNPETPQLVSAVHIGWDIETIYPYEGNLFIGSREAMYIYSLENPGKPAQKSVARHVRACDPVVALGHHAYVTVRAGTTCGGTINALLIYDVSDQAMPKQISTTPLAEPYGLGIKEHTLYICDGSAGLKVFDISDPKSPASLTNRTGHVFKDCIPYNDMLVCMVDGGLVIYDITNPNNPIFVTELK